MNSCERVKNLLQGKTFDRQPIYGWVVENLRDEITAKWGSVANFEDKYEFDMAHIFGGPHGLNLELISKIGEQNGELTPDLLLDVDIFSPLTDESSFIGVKEGVAHHKKRNRFCYVQTPGFFEHFNSAFGIENQLMWLALYPDEIAKLYERQVDWTIAFADKCIDLGVDCIHISDDWGSQKDLMFSPSTWQELIYPNLKKVIDHVHSKGVFTSLHSDGCISRVTDKLVDLKIDLVHPWQENAGMGHDLYLEKYSDKFGIMGGICVQSAIGILPREELEKEIRRVFANLKGKRWICCTSHFVQNHCSIEDLEFAYNLIYKLARE